MGKESEEEWIYVYVLLIHFDVYLKLHNIVSQQYSNKIKKKTSLKEEQVFKEWLWAVS